MSNEISSELLIQYLDNELNAAQRTSVEAALAADPALRQLLGRLQLAKQAFQQYARSNAVSTILKDEMKQQQPARVVKMSPLRRIIRIAALIIVLLVIGGIIQYSLLDAGRLYSAQYKEFSLGTLRDNDSISLLERSFREHNMPAVISVYERSAINTDHFLAGLAYLKTGNAEKAVAAFEKQLSVNQSLTLKPYQEDAEYYLALAYLKANNPDAALPIFERINGQPQHAYSKEINAWFLMKLRWLTKKR